MLLHGWPGSIREFYEMFPLLTTSDNSSEYIFNVVCPCLPGFGWSQGANRPGFGPVELSIVLKNLMLRLGYNKFVIQGGDWGAAFGSHISTLFPDNVLGFHTNFCTIQTSRSMIKLVIASLWKSLFIEKRHESFIFPISEKTKLLLQEMGSFWMQSTKPDTIGRFLMELHFSLFC